MATPPTGDVTKGGMTGTAPERPLIWWLPACVTVFVWSHITTEKSHIHYSSSVHTGSCSTAFKFGKMSGYINVHVQVNFQNKKMYTCKAMVWFVLSPPN